MMPASTATMRPAASTNRLPGCMSAWKKPSRIAWRRKDWITARPSAARSWPARSIAGRSPSGVAVDPFRGQHVAAGQVPEGFWDPEIGVALRVVGKLGQGGGFEAQIHLDRHGAAQGLDHLRHPQAPRLGAEALAPRRHEGLRLEVAAEALADAGPHDLHRHGRAVGEPRLVDLRDRGRGDGRAEGGEEVRERPAEGVRHHALGLRLREGGHPVLEMLQVARGRRPDDVGAGGEELAELDVGGPEPGQRGGEAGGALVGAGPLDQPGEAQRAPGGGRQRARIDQRERPFAGQHEPGPHAPGRVGKAGQH